MKTDTKRWNLIFGFDDILVPTKKLMADYIFNKYGIRAKEEECKISNFFQTINRADPKMETSYVDLYLNFGVEFFSSLNLKEDLRLFDGAAETIPVLSEKYNLYIVSERRNTEKDFMYEVLENQGVREHFSKIYCLWDYEKHSCHGLSKVDFIQSVDGKNFAFVDSSIKDVQKTKNILSSFLFDPQDQYKNETEIKRLFSWDQIQKTFE